MAPIGPKARHLNKEFHYGGGRENQLAHWSRIGVLKGAPAPGDAPRTAVWNDPATGSLDERAELGSKSTVLIAITRTDRPAHPGLT